MPRVKAFGGKQRRVHGFAHDRRQCGASSRCGQAFRQRFGAGQMDGQGQGEMGEDMFDATGNANPPL
jgi:hypothetical protein